MSIVQFQQSSGGISLCNLYFVYAASAMTFAFYGFYLDGVWRALQNDGNTLVLHVRTFTMLGLGAWALGA